MSNYEQCRARIHRAGQKFPCTYIHLVAKGTVDGKVMQALKNKANLAKSLIDDWAREITRLHEEVTDMEEKISNEMFALAERLKELRDAKSASEQKTKDINAELDEVEQELAQMMVDTETQNFTRGGTMFSLTNKTRASAVADSKAKLYRALKRKGHGDLVYETVNANSLSAFVNEQIAENNEELPKWLNGLVNVYEQTKVSVRKAARK